MAIAFVLINTDAGVEEEVAIELVKIDAVKEAHPVYGVYDVIAKVEAENMEKLKAVVSGKIRRMDKIRSTLTMLVIGE